MRTPITLEEFVFTLCQEEDIMLNVMDYFTDRILYHGWKLDSIVPHGIPHSFGELGEWYVQYFATASGGLEIFVVKDKKDLDWLF